MKHIFRVLIICMIFFISCKKYSTTSPSGQNIDADKDINKSPTTEKKDLKRSPTPQRKVIKQKINKDPKF